MKTHFLQDPLVIAVQVEVAVQCYPLRLQGLPLSAAPQREVGEGGS
jgi:hypothetical protein